MTHSEEPLNLSISDTHGFYRCFKNFRVSFKILHIFLFQYIQTDLPLEV